MIEVDLLFFSESPFIGRGLLPFPLVLDPSCNKNGKGMEQGLKAGSDFSKYVGKKRLGVADVCVLMGIWKNHILENPSLMFMPMIDSDISRSF